MSLLFRKKVQPILDKVGLANYHVAINRYKNVEIQGECGQSLIVIGGIEFSRVGPNGKEIDYAVELMQDFVDTHKVLIGEFNDAVTELTKARTTMGKNPDMSDRWHYDNEVRYTDGCFEVYLSKNGKVHVNTNRNSKKPYTVKVINDFKLDPLKLKIAQKYIKDAELVNKARSKVNKITEKLGKCDI